MTRWHRLWAAVLLAMAAAALGAANAQAHADAVVTDPSDGAVLAGSPQVIRLSFSEEIALELSSVHIADSQGRRIDPLAVEAGSGGETLVVRLPPLRHDAYSIKWQVLSADDAHVTAGALAFAVGGGISAPTAGRDPPSASPGLLETMVRWLGFALLAGLIGGLAVAILVITAAAPLERARTRALRLAFTCGVLSVPAGLLLALVQAEAVAAASPDGTPLSAALGRLLSTTRWGSLWISREALLAGGIALCALLLRRRLPARLVLPSAALLAGALCAVQALASHAGALPRETGIAVAADALHVLAASIWVGGLAALAVALLPLTELRGSGQVRAVLQRFGGLAAASVVLVTATGLYSAGREVGSLEALGSTSYGRLLLGKTGLFLAVGAVGALNALLLRPNLAAPLARLLRRPRGWTPVDAKRLPRLILAEAAAGFLVLLLAGALTSTSPTLDKRAAVPKASQRATLVREADDILVSLSCTPSVPGPTICEATAVQTRRPVPGPIERIGLRLPGATAFTTMRRAAPARFHAGGKLARSAGLFRADVRVERRGAEPTLLRFSWRPPGLAPASRGSLERPLTAAALALLLLACTATWLLRGAGRERLPTASVREPA
jgi:copper transport protein